MAPRLERSEKGLELVTDEGQRLFLDFVADRAHYLKPHRGKSELIAKATGLSKGYREIWDLTAGLAEDAWFLVRLGARVTAFERHPLISELVQDAWQRASQNPSTEMLAQNFRLIPEDAIQFLQKLPMGEGPEVIYLDPMFSFKKEKSALPRKEMQIFRAVVGSDSDSLNLLKESLRVAKDRVVVKRPLKEAPLLDGVQHRFEGSSIRFDLYQPASFRMGVPK